MNCHDVTQLLVPYLDHEVTPSERRLIQAHLAGCASCQREQAALSTTRNRLAHALKTQAAQAAPSPQALSRLQARLADDAQRPSQRLSSWLKRPTPDASRRLSIPQGAFLMKHRFAFAALAALLVVAAMTFTIPTVRAQVQQIIVLVTTGSAKPDPAVASVPGPLAQFNSGSGVITASSGLVSAVPAGSALATAAQGPISEEVYQNGNQFMIVTRTQPTGEATLPEGQATTVNDQPAVLQTGLSGEYRQQLPAAEGAVDQDGKPARLPTPIVIRYTNANKLTWMADGVKVEVISNLAVESLLKAAEALPPVQ